MCYDKEKLESIIKQSCDSLLTEQPMLFQKSADVNERTISGELSTKIREHFSGFHINCEYNRMTDENGVQIPKRIHMNPNDPDPTRVFPDIIVHRQEDGDHNLLIIEIKMSWKNNKKEEDFQKLERYIPELKYQYGLYLELGQEGVTEMKWFQ